MSEMGRLASLLPEWVDLCSLCGCAPILPEAVVLTTPKWVYRNWGQCFCEPSEIFNCEMYGCENRITKDAALEESCDGGVFNGPYAAALKRDLLVCYDCDDQLTMTPPPDRHQWILNSEKEVRA